MKVSILIPAYNAEKYIAETIKCAIGQTWTDKEIIVVDDGSKDNTFEIAKSFESDIVKVFRQTNKGASAARNFAFAQSTGDMIQYLDADDLLSPNKIENQMKLHLEQGNEKSIVVCNFLYFTGNIISGLYFPNCRLISTSYAPGFELLIDIFDYSFGTQTSMWLTPRSLIAQSGGWNEKISLNDDGEFFFRIVSQCGKVLYCSNAIVYYRMPEEGLSQRRDAAAAMSQITSTRVMRDIILSFSKSRRARLACCKFYMRYYNQFDDKGYYNSETEKDIRELGFNLNLWLSPKKTGMLRSAFRKGLKKLINESFI